MMLWAFGLVGVLAVSTRVAPRPAARPGFPQRPGDPQRPGRPREQCSRVAPTEWADIADTIGRHLRTGHSLRRALHLTLQHRAPTGRVLHGGASLDDVIDAYTDDADEMVVVRALQTAWQLGGPAATGLHAAAALLRERRAARADARAQSAQARTSARVLTAVPLVFGLLGIVSSPSFRAVVSSPPGAVASLAGALLNLAGWQWMRVVVRKATS